MGNVTKSLIEQALVEVRKFILSDGGDLEVTKVIDHQVFIKLKGACVGCPLSFYTVQMGISRALKEKISSQIEVILEDED